MKKGLVGCTGLLMLGLSVTSQATLYDRGNGMIYDSDQDLTWLQDANYAKTSGYDANGQMSWRQAIAWADDLLFGGYDDWRLPTVIDTGTPGANASYGGTDAGYNVDTSASELAYMFQVILGNESAYNPDGSRNIDGCAVTRPWCGLNASADGVDIINFQSYNYWSGTESLVNTGLAWSYGNSTGHQTEIPKGFLLYAWAVRDGDVAAASVPEPGTFLLTIAGLAGLGAVRRKQATKGR